MGYYLTYLFSTILLSKYICNENLSTDVKIKKTQKLLVGQLTLNCEIFLLCIPDYSILGIVANSTICQPLLILFKESILEFKSS